MPVISYKNEPFPDWSEVKSCKIIGLSKRQKLQLSSEFSETLLFVLDGAAEISDGTGEKIVFAGDVWEPFSEVVWIEPKPLVELFQISGNWSNDRGSCGVFKLERSEQAHNDGDPADYDRNTVFDNHFHDCDEYWFIIKGKGMVVSEGESYAVQAGDCVITPAGEHHDFPIVYEPILAVWFEGSLKGKKRPGHLYCEK